MLETKNISKSFGGLRAVNNCSIKVEKSRITGLIGPNGAGKTTLFNVITGFLKRDEGEVWFDGEEVGSLLPHEIAMKGMVRTFQTAAGFMHMTVMENMMIAPQAQEGEMLWRTLFFPGRIVRTQEEEARTRAAEILNFMGLYEKRNEYVENLSSAEAKLLEVGRQLLSGAKLVLLDEPMSGVSPAFQGRMVEYLGDIRERGGLTFFVIEHNLNFIRRVSDVIYVMNNGELLSRGTWDEVIQDEKVIEAYLGGRR